MSVYHCWKCNDTGEDLSNFCTCSLGRKLAQQERAPVWPSSILEEAAEASHNAIMALQNKRQCWACDIWRGSECFEGGYHNCNQCRENPDWQRKSIMGV